MITVIFFMVLTLSMPIDCAKEALELKTVRVINLQSSFEKVPYDSCPLNMSQICTGELEKNLLTFLRRNLEINPAVSQLGENYTYKVIFNSRKGKLSTDLDLNGELLFYFLNYKNVVIPYNFKGELTSDKGIALKSKSLQAGEKGNLSCKGNFRPQNLYFKIGAGALS